MASADAILHEQRNKVAGLEQALHEARLELKAMERIAASLGKQRPSRPAERSVGGRQSGAISMRWRRVLGTLGALYRAGFSTGNVIEAVKRFESREMKPSEVRRLFEGYVAQRIVEVVADDIYRVTDDAWVRLNLQESADVGQNVPNENEGPEADATGASDGSGPDAGTSEPLNLDNPYRLRAVEGG
jgi:hypothetical protein